MSAIREYWRVTALVVLLLLSSVALFAPGLGDTAPEGQAVEASGASNLAYGLDLSGGARVRATVDGVTATGVNVTAENQATITRDVAEELDLRIADVRARPARDGGTVEAFGDVTESELATALESAGYQSESVRSGVTQTTRDNIVETLQAKIDASGFAAANVQDVQAQTGEGTHYIVVEAANRNVSEVSTLMTSRGVVTILANYPSDGEQVNETVLTQEQLRDGQIGVPTTTQDGRPAVPITLSDDVAQQYAEDMVEYGFADGAAASSCEYENGTAADGSYCLLTVRDGEVVYSAGVRHSLGQSFANGEFVKDPSFIITATSMQEARQLSVDLNAGSLPAPLTVEDTFFMAPSMGSQFKIYSLITGIMAVFAVSGAVFFRYREPRIALPMIVTALSEVYILLGFAASVGLALDLSHIAGLIAVVGTGVDDLVIIADEVMAEEVSSRRVFQSRFRKAFWVIGAAAVTTIIAMGPLAVLSLGDLRGFAIITILGVLVGVLVTRPAYGDILRRLLTVDH
ncbi:preprotein translocase subunit SecD [Halanaeroarchaeum sulfurireducens]|uniref:Protein-export membrane protein SecD n=1 Tax=Halanaeroarchaeum sulfurireducens TaxID=1604004 RepID=A0A0F7P6D0_9EURY|nr:preprotein translocase subunit SecD [Halanaeroarchaeum sulfurireducens]AKH96696.1 preprotein translocase subunit SecD [Halanaeroarchaeum sulfurireducens]ALG81098.1 preprotein translocase subunit SecD [Halanaeroarchaeum sulfurireducens]